MPLRPTITRLAVCAGAIGVVVSTFLPWLQSGQERRSSYELVGVARRLQQVPTEAIRAATFWWPVVPLLVVASVIAVLWGMARLGAVLGLLGAIYVGAFAIVFWNLDIPPLGGVQVVSTLILATGSSAVFSLASIVNALGCSSPVTDNVGGGDVI